MEQVIEEKKINQLYGGQSYFKKSNSFANQQLQQQQQKQQQQQQQIQLQPSTIQKTKYIIGSTREEQAQVNDIVSQVCSIFKEKEKINSDLLLQVNELEKELKYIENETAKQGEVLGIFSSSNSFSEHKISLITKSIETFEIDLENQFSKLQYIFQENLKYVELVLNVFPTDLSILYDLKKKYFDDYQVLSNQILQMSESIKLSKDKLNNSKLSVSKFKNIIEDLENELLDNKKSLVESEILKIETTKIKETSNIEFNKEDDINKKNEMKLIALKEDLENKSNILSNEINEIESKIKNLEEENIDNDNQIKKKKDISNILQAECDILINELNTETKNNENLLQIIDESNNKQTELSNQLAVLKSLDESLTKQNKNLDIEISENQSIFSNIKLEATKLEKELDNDILSMTNNMNEINILRKDEPNMKCELAKERENLTRRIVLLELQLPTLNNDIKKIKFDIENTNKEIEDKKNSLKTFNDTFQENKSINSKLKDSITLNNNEMKELSLNIDKLKEENVEINNYIDSYSLSEIENKKLKSLIEDQESAIDKENEDIEKLEQKLIEMKKLSTDLKKKTDSNKQIHKLNPSDNAKNILDKEIENELIASNNELEEEYQKKKCQLLNQIDIIKTRSDITSKEITVLKSKIQETTTINEQFSVQINKQNQDINEIYSRKLALNKETEVISDDNSKTEKEPVIEFTPMSKGIDIDIEEEFHSFNVEYDNNLSPIESVSLLKSCGKKNAVNNWMLDEDFIVKDQYKNTTTPKNSSHDRMKNLSETKRKFKKENIVGKSIDKNKVNKVAKSSKTVSKINPKVVKENIKVKHKVNSPGDWFLDDMSFNCK